jgi:hypothetical protein
MKRWNLAVDAQVSRVIIVVVQVGAIKKYVASVEALRKSERERERGSQQDETQFTTKKWCSSLSFTPPPNDNVLFCRFFFNLTWLWTKIRVLVFS